MPITWRNVNAPNNNQSGFFQGADLFGRGIENLSNVFNQAQAKQDADKLKIQESQALEDAFGIQGMTKEQLANIDIRGKSKAQIKAITAARDNRAKDIITQSNSDREFNQESKHDADALAIQLQNSTNTANYQNGSLKLQGQRLTNSNANADRTYNLALSNSKSNGILRDKQLELSGRRLTNEISKGDRADKVFNNVQAKAAKIDADKLRILGAKEASTTVNDDGSITFDPTQLTNNGATNQEAYNIIKGNEAAQLSTTRATDEHNIKKQGLQIKQQAQDQKGRVSTLSKDDLAGIEDSYGSVARSMSEGLSGRYPRYVVTQALAASKEKTLYGFDNSFDGDLFNGVLAKFDEEFKLEAAKRALTGSQ